MEYIGANPKTFKRNNEKQNGNEDFQPCPTPPIESPSPHEEGYPEE